MFLRVDKRSKLPFSKQFKGIPVVTEQKYLGVVVDDRLDFKL